MQDLSKHDVGGGSANIPDSNVSGGISDSLGNETSTNKSWLAGGDVYKRQHFNHFISPFITTYPFVFS